MATSGDFSWPPAGTSTGHQWILSHGHGHSLGPYARRLLYPISLRRRTRNVNSKSLACNSQVEVLEQRKST